MKWFRLATLVRATVVTYVLLLVALPVVALVYHAAGGGPAEFWKLVTDPTGVDALILTVATSALAATITTAAGTAIVWAIIRRRLPGRGIITALVDVPFAVPTLVTGVVLVAFYGPHTWLGRTFTDLGFPIAFARPGIVLALLFIGLPLAVRTIEPVLAELDPDEEDAAQTLGANKVMVFRHVLLPALWPAIAAAWVQVFARSIAEFGSIAAISGNVPGDTLVASVYILGELESGNARGAAAVSVVLLAGALLLQPLWQMLASRGGRRG